MTKIYKSIYSMPCAELGKNNPNPDFKNIDYIHAGYRVTENVTSEETEYFGKGMISTILPYMVQDNYNRERKEKNLNSVVMENDYLKAVFLPELGGRLWSLWDKKLNRELLYVNSVFQPANLAIRNAWFSGGVEWNFAIKGHNPLTCDALFSDICKTADGKAVLRMYEYERIRDVVICIEAYLPDDSDVLYIRNTIENTSNNDTFLYWWSNIAVPETEYTRVISPCEESFLCHYFDNAYTLDKIKYPFTKEKDLSYPKNSAVCQDYFFKIPSANEKWVAAVEGDGKGLIHFSTSELVGRKMFVWGQSNGGKHWSEFLSTPGEKYIEIQAGLLSTQLEHKPMKSGETISWVEGYCAANCGEVNADTAPWHDAIMEIKRQIGTKININNIDNFLKEMFPNKFVSTEHITSGSGWGYIEQEFRKGHNMPRISNIVDFPYSSMGDCEEQWLNLMNNNAFDKFEICDEPKSYMVNSKWGDLIKSSAKISRSWYSYLQLGVYYYAQELIDDALAALKKSTEIEKNCWALRNIAMIYKNDYKDYQTAAEYMIEAFEMNPTERGITINLAQTLSAAQKYNKWLEISNELEQPLRNDGRVLYYNSEALLKTGKPKEALDILCNNFVMADIKEGEASVSNLWFEIQKALGTNKDIPYSLDFRMH